MICPNCGTRVGSGLTKCHFCRYEFPSEINSDTDFKKQELYLNKFIALFTIFAFAVASAAILSSALSNSTDSTSANVLGKMEITWIISILFGFIITWVYYAMSPWFIKRLFNDRFLRSEKK